MVCGAVLILVVVAWQVYALAWESHSERVGRALVRRFLQDRAQVAPVQVTTLPTDTGLAPCAGSAGSTGLVKGVLEIPRLGVTAPVENGTGDAQLDVAVGHDPQSVWPDAPGTAVFAAHDVSYFVGLSKLSPADTVLYVTPCTTFVYAVTSQAVVKEGSPVYNSPGSTIALVTCWPTDALWFTPDRYVVSAQLVGQKATAAGSGQYLGISPPPSVPVPAALASQGVTLDTYSLPMGTFTLTGIPDPAWAQTTNPLLVQDSAVEAFIAGVRSLAEDRLDWWRSVAPGVDAPAALVGAGNPQYSSPLDVAIAVTGSQATAATLTDRVEVSGGSAPGSYAMTVDETIAKGTLVVSSWVVTRSPSG